MSTDHEQHDTHSRQLEQPRGADSDGASTSLAPQLPPGVLQRKLARRIQRRAQGGLQRKAAVWKSGADLSAMTLGQFEAYTREQADWATGPAVGPNKDKLWRLLELARAEEALLAGCGPMKVADLIATGLDVKSLAPLRSYCGAVHKDRATVEIEPVADVHKAIRMGEALATLEKTPGGMTVKTVMKQTASQPQLQSMIDQKAVDPFVQYVNTVHPVLQANTGAEIDSYLAMKNEGVDPAATKPQVPRVRNLHRFEKSALDAFARNEKDTSKARPLTLVLHSALDHNGAFHRDPNVTAVAKHPKNLSLMIEGKETLADIQDELDPLARKYGQGDKIDQVMFAGHGASRVIELAGKVTDGANRLEATRDNVDLDHNKANTDALFDELMKHMDPASPNHRVIFNACLTNSNEVRGPLSSDPDTARKEIKAAIAKDASLATTFKERAKSQGMDIDSRGANGSIGEIGLIDKASGHLDLVSKTDPFVTAAKIKYVEFGREPEGVLRAVVEEFARDEGALLAAMKRRQATGVPDDWDLRIIHTLFAILLAGHERDASLMNSFADGAGHLGEAKLEDACRVPRIVRAVPGAWVTRVYGELAKTSTWKTQQFVPLVFYQAWLLQEPTQGAHFLSHLGAHFTCHSASRFVALASIDGQLPSLLPAPSASPSKGELTLALLDVAKRKAGANPASIAFLQAILGGERWFPKALGVVARLGGLATETEILAAIGRDKPSAKAPAPNVDLDRDGTNDLYVEPRTKTALVDVPSADIYQKPDKAAPKVGALTKGTEVHIVGKVGSEWHAIEHGGTTAFVQVIDIAA